MVWDDHLIKESAALPHLDQDSVGVPVPPRQMDLSSFASVDALVPENPHGPRPMMSGWNNAKPNQPD